MDPLPKDPAARRQALERWAEEQAQRTRRAPLPTRITERAIGARRLERGLLSADRVLGRFADRLFDRGPETSEVVELPEHRSAEQAHYVASQWHVLPRALRYIGVSDRDTFVDFGCGKGRVVHQAARRPFRRVVGVELSPELAATARAVLTARSHRHRCRNVEIVAADVRDFAIPDDLTVAYFFRPFGDETLSVVLERIIESIDRNPRRVRLVYDWEIGDARATILATRRFRLLTEQSGSLVKARLPPVAIYESR